MLKAIYNAQNTVRTNGSGKPSISFGKSGGVAISKAGAAFLGLKVGDRISFGQDEADDWYVFKSPEGFELRQNNSELLCFNSATLYKKLVLSNDLLEGKTHRFIIAGQPTVDGKIKYYGLLKPANI